VVEGPTGIEVGREQDREHRMVAEHRLHPLSDPAEDER
jgi:hypothetical protein